MEEVFGQGRRDIGGASDVGVHVGNLRPHVGNDLDRRTSRANNGNSLVFVINIVIPLRRVEECALERLQTSNFRPLPGVEESTTAAQNWWSVRWSSILMTVHCIAHPLMKISAESSTV